jgi:hypothetical protein
MPQTGVELTIDDPITTPYADVTVTYADVCLKAGVELTVDDPIMATQKQVHTNK